MEIETIEIESSVIRGVKASFWVTISLYDPTVYYIFRELASSVCREIRVRVINRELVYNTRLTNEEIKYFEKNIV